MIKLPINVANSSVTSWKDCLTQARDRRDRLAELADEAFPGDRAVHPADCPRAGGADGQGPARRRVCP